MKLYYYRGERPNFGDELNTWLMPKIFPDFFDDDPSVLFLAIGSIINDDHDRSVTKIVFGSGYGGYRPLPDFDETWRFYAVRGPHTAAACNLTPDKVAADAAILINSFRNPDVPKVHKFSFMPHWESIGRGHWEIACRLAGIHFISPWKPVDEVLGELEATETLITEAMHGAIVADALRVPWVAVQPFHMTHRAKWLDWAQALDIVLKQIRLAPSGYLEAKVEKNAHYHGRFKDPRGVNKLLVKFLDTPHILRAVASLRLAKTIEPSLSSDAALARALDKLKTAVSLIRRDFAPERLKRHPGVNVMEG